MKSPSSWQPPKIPKFDQTLAETLRARIDNKAKPPGSVVGSVSAAMWLLASEFWCATVAAQVAVVTSIVLTGALHEDGLADTTDAFGGGWSIKKRLAIMKDSYCRLHRP